MNTPRAHLGAQSSIVIRRRQRARGTFLLSLSPLSLLSLRRFSASLLRLLLLRRRRLQRGFITL